MRQEGSAQSGDGDHVSPGGRDVSVGTGGGSSRGGEMGGSFHRGSKKVALTTLPAVEGRYDDVHLACSGTDLFFFLLKQRSIRMNFSWCDPALS